MGNVFGDLFYPDNPKRRQRVHQLTQKLYDYMKTNFRATNRLTDFLNENMNGANFTHIFVNEDETVGFNCNVLKKQISAAQVLIEKVDKTLAEKLDPALYEKLKNVDLSFEERVETGYKAMTVVTGIALTAASIAVCVAIASGGILAPVVAVLGVLATSAISSAAIALIGGVVIGAIVGAITGAIERDKLEEAIAQLEGQLESFGPASVKYTESIYDVLAELKFYELR